MVVEVLGVDAKIPVKEEEELLLHEVDFSDGESKVFVATDGGVPGPVLVLWGRVIEVFSRKDERSQEDPVDGAAHAFGDGRKARP